MWLGFAGAILFAGAGGLLDLVALVIAASLTAVIGWYVHRAGGRWTLLRYLVVAGIAALIGPVLVL